MLEIESFAWSSFLWFGHETVLQGGVMPRTQEHWNAKFYHTRGALRSILHL